MLVQCNAVDPSGGISMGTTYTVVAIAINIGAQDISFNIMDDFGKLRFYNDSLFIIEDDYLDIDWVFKKMSPLFVKLIPQTLSYASFYEDFHNDDVKAIENFKKRFPEIKKDS